MRSLGRLLKLCGGRPNLLVRAFGVGTPPVSPPLVIDEDAYFTSTSTSTSSSSKFKTVPNTHKGHPYRKSHARDDGSLKRAGTEGIEVTKQIIIDERLSMGARTRPGHQTINNVFAAYNELRGQGRMLTPEELHTVVWACYEDRENSRSDVIVEIYVRLKELKHLEADDFATIMQILVRKQGLSVGKKLFRDVVYRDYLQQHVIKKGVKAAFHTLPEGIMVSLILACTVQWEPSRADLLFKTFRERHLRGTEGMYWELAKMYLKDGDGLKSVGILRYMMHEAGIMPTSTKADNLLRLCLRYGDTRIVRTLLHWYIHNWVDVLVERGLLKKLFHLASAVGDSELAFQAQNLMERMGYEMEYTDYVCLTRACLLDSDLPGVLKALVESDINGIDIYSDSTVGRSLEHHFVRTLSFNVLVKYPKKIDDTYFAVVDLKAQNEPMKNITMALNAIIMSYGKKNMYNRAYATFQECSSMFEIVPTVHTYNALLYAIACADGASVEKILAVYQDMEQANVSPDSDSFSILCEVMASTGKLQGFDETHEHIKSLGLRLHERSFRKVLLTLCKQGSFESVDTLVSSYYRVIDMNTVGNVAGNDDDNKERKTTLDDRPIMPLFLKRRIEVLREMHTIHDEQLKTALECGDNIGNVTEMNLDEEQDLDEELRNDFLSGCRHAHTTQEV